MSAATVRTARERAMIDHDPLEYLLEHTVLAGGRREPFCARCRSRESLHAGSSAARVKA